ncbi:hypothetical protein ABVK25_002262 [Lepraria finkii]|uniref:Uncharacterized protein n=1 Tax=Lepraria finkii TaxID=1340010 RepID=A0ABR4BHC9_9LECA
MLDTAGPMASAPLSTSVVENAQTRSDDECDQESGSSGDESDYESDDEDKTSDELPTDLPDDEEPGKASDNNSTSSIKIREAHSKTAVTQDRSTKVHAAADGQVENIEQKNGAGEGTSTSTETGTGVKEVD